MRIAIIGAGYVGLPLACILKHQGHQLIGWVASETSAAKLSHHGIQPFQADATNPEDWKNFPQPCDTLIFCLSSTRNGSGSFHAIHQQALSYALAHPHTQFLYTSSTSVYTHNDGSLVDESTPLTPGSESTKTLIHAENAVLQAGGIVARLSGIYGPGRGHLYRKLIEGTATIDGDGSRWLNQIHRDDAASALSFLASQPNLKQQIFNITDNEPVQLRHFYQWASETFHRPYPPHSETSAPRKRGNTSKRVSNLKIRNLGWNPQYPTFREGYLHGMIEPST